MLGSTNISFAEIPKLLNSKSSSLSNVKIIKSPKELNQTLKTENSKIDIEKTNS